MLQITSLSAEAHMQTVRKPTGTVCRVCEAMMAETAGTVEYIAGYCWDVMRCGACGCQFTRHDADVYDIMHKTGAISYYSDYRSMAERSRACFDRKDLDGLRDLLTTSSSKYRFVMERISRLPQSARILEIGSSRGYLTAYSILSGRKILGVDVSQEAVTEARAQFGDHFAVAGEPRIEGSAPFDLVYHVGMIGCVADPVGLTHDLLQLIRPGGTLIFNAPNRDALYLNEQLWLDSAPPPDLVTLFPPGFFKSQFSASADVEEEMEMLPPGPSLQIGLLRMLGVVWSNPDAKPIEAAGEKGLAWSQSPPAHYRFLSRAIGKTARLIGLDALAPRRPTDFGLFVTMVRK